MTGRIATALTITFLGACACARWDRAAVVGVWVATDVPEAVASSIGARLHFREDGTFSASGVPQDLIVPFPTELPRALSAEGNWSIRSDRPSVELKTRRIEGVITTPHFSRLHCGGWGTRHTLSFFVGDPDDGLRVTFRKEPAARG